MAGIQIVQLQCNSEIMEPISAELVNAAGRLLTASGLFPGRLSQRLIDPVLPARPSLLEMIQHVSIDAQRDELFGIWESGFLWGWLQWLRRCHLERRLGLMSRIGCSSRLVERHICHPRFVRRDDKNEFVRADATSARTRQRKVALGALSSTRKQRGSLTFPACRISPDADGGRSTARRDTASARSHR
jgi:hypothetical protein